MLIALGFEQLAEQAHWRHQVEQGTEELRSSLSGIAAIAVEQQVSAPCLDRQLRDMQARLLASGPYRPAPLYNDPMGDFTIRRPSRLWSDDAWRIVTTEGIATHLNSDVREGMEELFFSIEAIRRNSAEADVLTWRLDSLALPGAIDPTVRVRVLEEISELRGRSQLMTLQSGQIFGNIKELGMMPDPALIQRFLDKDSGTVAFCRTHRYPLGQPRPIPT